MGLRRFEGRYRKAEDVEAASPSKAFLYLHKGDLEPISEVRRSESYHYTWSRIDDDEEECDDDGCGRGGGRSGGLPEFVSLTL